MNYCSVLKLYIYLAVFIQCSADSTEKLIKKYLIALSTLAYCSKVEVGVTPPVGCAILTVAGKCEIHLMLKVRHS